MSDACGMGHLWGNLVMHCRAGVEWCIGLLVQRGLLWLAPDLRSLFTMNLHDDAAQDGMIWQSSSRPQHDLDPARFSVAAQDSLATVAGGGRECCSGGVYFLLL